MNPEPTTNHEPPATPLNINIIAAMSENRVIGRNGQLPWRLPDEMKHFMRLTTGNTIIMGRKTFESINSKPLPNRRNIILTQNPDYPIPDNVERANNIQAAIQLASKPTTNHQPPTTNIFICGGEQAYRDALPLADTLYLTVVHAEFEGDAHFPKFDESEWTLAEEIRHDTDEKHAYAFTFNRYERKEPTGS